MPPGSVLRWNKAAGRYIDRRGKFISQAQVRRDLDQALEQSSRAITRLGEDLMAGQMSLQEWELRVRTEVKTLQLYSAAVAKGGTAQLTQADLGRVGAAVKKQYAYLRRFAGQIEGGLPLDGRFLARLRMYGQAGRRMYHLMDRQEHEARGYTEERNVLGVADHCAGCLDATAAGWVPIGALTPVGERDCLTACKCSVRYRKRPAPRRRR